MRFVRPILALAALFASMPAAADDGRRHVMTPTQKIDMVRDLPDIATFEKDGFHYDLGFIYPIHTLNGTSVASTGGGEAGFVLYHDDRYVRVDSGIMADLEMVLGEDPTQGYTPPKPVSRSATAADPWGAGANGAGKPVSDPNTPRFGYRPPARHSGTLSGWMIPFLGFGIIAGIRFGIPAILRMIFGGGLARAIVRTRAASMPTSSEDRFEARLAARLAEVRDDPMPMDRCPATPAASGGFGRKGL